jgi:CheY-like chemotaxis protein
VLNLAINARDAMPSGGRLTVVTGPAAAETPDGSGDTSHVPGITLRIIDTGHGMPPEVVARAFEPFFTTKPRGQGTGLGLATVYGIVLQNGGAVTIDSAEGVGTEVIVTLPGSEDPVPAREASVAARGGDERILLVEDQSALRAGTSRILTEHGYEVLTASDGTEALAVLDDCAGAISLVVTDVAMPRMGGHELARLLALRSPGIPVIFMSGYDSDASPAPGPMLAKPVTQDALLRAIRDQLDG